ncbi:MAG: DUF547 domain-containing protein [Flavobacteriaceae bacterium]|nr:MAG: DUF547 domain-containing protein [Flavobacteriaceae bacterium]
MKRRRILFTAFFVFCLSNVKGQEMNMFFKKANTFFSTYVKDGKVAYKTVSENPLLLEELVALTKNAKIEKEPKEEYQAFWINAYNILVIDQVVKNYPLKSPLDVNGFFDSKIYEVGALSFTLNDIENKILRKKFPDEARFHFVLVCAGLGCPPIIDEAYVPQKLEMQLQRQTEIALNNPEFIRVSGNKVKVSQIFQWYKNDFIKKKQGLVDFINRYRQTQLPENAKISYYSYDWRLNEEK